MSSKDEKKQHWARVLLGEECIRTNVNEVQDWGNLLLSRDFKDTKMLFCNIRSIYPTYKFSEYPNQKENYKWRKDTKT